MSGYAPPPGQLIGSVVGGRYQVLEPIGEGGMGAVYLARHLGMQTEVALKLMNPLVVNERSVARFIREARAASRVDHDNVIGVIDFGQADEGFYYYVMEHVRGRSLADELARLRSLPVERAVRILAQIASGLGRAHGLGIVHRDLKPENVLLTHRDGDPDFVKIIDFGLAKSAAFDAAVGPVTLQGEAFGTPDYMAPEQWQGRTIDARTDIYGFGVLAYEMLTGKPPFEGDTRTLMIAHLSMEPVPPSRRARAAVPAGLERLVLDALRKSPDERPRSMEEILQRLRALWDEMSAVGGSLGDATTLQLGSPDTLPDGGGEACPIDGLALVAEIQRLHALRGRRLAELARTAWSDAPPGEVADALARTGSLESRIEEEGEAVALLKARLDEARARSLARRADLRAQILDASLAIGQLETPSGGGAPTHGQRHTPPETLRDSAERGLTEAQREWDAELARVREEMTRRIAAIRGMEVELRPALDQLARVLREEAQRRPELGQHVRELDRIHRALAAFEGLLASVGG